MIEKRESPVIPLYILIYHIEYIHRTFFPFIDIILEILTVFSLLKVQECVSNKHNQ